MSRTRAFGPHRDPAVRRPNRVRDRTRMKVFGIAGWSNAGKTTARRASAAGARTARPARLRRQARTREVRYRTGPARDSYRFREAGSPRSADQLAGALGPDARASRCAPEAGLADLLPHLSDCDLVLVEGFKRDPIPKLEVHRVANGKPLLSPDDPHIVAIASDATVATDLPLLSIDDVEAIAAFIVATLGLPQGASRPDHVLIARAGLP